MNPLVPNPFSQVQVPGAAVDAALRHAPTAPGLTAAGLASLAGGSTGGPNPGASLAGAIPAPVPMGPTPPSAPTPPTPPTPPSAPTVPAPRAAVTFTPSSPPPPVRGPSYASTPGGAAIPVPGAPAMPTPPPAPQIAAPPPPLPPAPQVPAMPTPPAPAVPSPRAPAPGGPTLEAPPAPSLQAAPPARAATPQDAAAPPRPVPAERAPSVPPSPAEASSGERAPAAARTAPPASASPPPRPDATAPPLQGGVTAPPPSTPAAVTRWALQVGQRLLDVPGYPDMEPLGASVYTFLSGQPPPDLPARQAAVARQQADPLVPLRHLREDVPASLEHAVHRMMALAAADRFPTVQSALDALETVLDETEHAPRERAAATAEAARPLDPALPAPPSHAPPALPLVADTAAGDGPRRLVGEAPPAPASPLSLSNLLPILANAPPIPPAARTAWPVVLVLAIWLLIAPGLPSLETTVDLAAAAALVILWRRLHRKMKQSGDTSPP